MRGVGGLVHRAPLSDGNGSDQERSWVQPCFGRCRKRQQLPGWVEYQPSARFQERWGCHFLQRGD